MSRTAYIWLLLGLPVVFWRCKDPYISPYKSPATGYLVVEGYISGNTTTQFMLSRAIPLPGDSTLPTESGATVQILGSDNSSYPLSGMGNGVYSTIDTLKLNPQLQYRLSIKTSNGEQYLSDLVPYKSTPPIDSINWIQNGDYSIQIYANTHDPANNTHYYLWNYDQTYEYHSAEDSYDYWDKDTTPPAAVPRPANEQVYRCWQSGSSTSIIISNSTKLASDVIYEQPVKYIPPSDVQTSVLYSILVREYALTADGYNFLSLMQQNTESLGSIFDVQPSTTVSNIQCLTNSKEQVIGWVSAGTVQQQRIWITRAQVPSNYIYECQRPDTVLGQDSVTITRDFGSGLFTPIYFDAPPAKEVGWQSNFSGCVDCRLQGGTTVKPSIWPY